MARNFNEAAVLDDMEVGVFLYHVRPTQMPDLERGEDRRFGRNDIYRRMTLRETYSGEMTNHG